MRLTPAGQEDYDRRTRQNTPGFELGAIAQENWDYQHQQKAWRSTRGINSAPKWTPPEQRTESKYRNLDAIKIRCLAQRFRRENHVSGPMWTAEGSDMIGEMQVEIDAITNKYLLKAKSLQRGDKG